MSTPDYVLQDFSADLADDLAIFLDRAADAALKFAHEGLEAAMTQYNRSES